MVRQTPLLWARADALALVKQRVVGSVAAVAFIFRAAEARCARGVARHARPCVVYSVLSTATCICNAKSAAGSLTAVAVGIDVGGSVRVAAASIQIL